MADFSIIQQCKSVLRFKGQGATAIMDTSTLWTSGRTINVEFLDTPVRWIPWQKAWIAHVITTTVMVYANLNFVFHVTTPVPTNKRCEIRITCDPNDGCYSGIGDQVLDFFSFPTNTMNFGWMDAPYNTSFTFEGITYRTTTGFDRGGYSGYGGTIIHEFGHALGMLHELQSPWNNPIVWDRTAVYSYLQAPPNSWTREQIDYNILSSIPSQGKNGSAFDVNSIMKYSLPRFMLSSPTTQQIIAAEQFNERQLSQCDAFWLATNYPGRNVSVSCPLAAFNPPQPLPQQTPQPPLPPPPPAPSPQPTPISTGPQPTPISTGPQPTPISTGPQPTPVPHPTPTPKPAPIMNPLVPIILVLIFVLLLVVFVYITSF